MKRREFISVIGGMAVWPLAARAQQQQAMPVIGLLMTGTAAGTPAHLLLGFHRGLKDSGYVEGENVAVVFRFAENQSERLPELAAELAHWQVAVIVVPGGTVPTLMAKAATATIPILFLVGDDPVKLGLVASLNRPAGNVTGINFLGTELIAKRLALLRELVPAAVRVAVLVNPANPANAETSVRDAEAAARAIGLQIEFVNGSTSQEIDAAFATLVRNRPDALVVGSDPFFVTRRLQLAHLAIRHALPATFPLREYAEAGGLMSYGSNITDALRQVGVYAGRILKGAKPAELPVVQASKFELVINHQTARMLGLTVPPTLLATADEVIE